MGLYRRGKTWWLTFFHNRERIATSTKQTDRRLAEKWAAAYRAAVQESRLLPRLKDAAIGDVLHRYLEVHLKAKNPTNYRDSGYSVNTILSKIPPETPSSRIRTLADDYRAWRLQCRSQRHTDKTVSLATVNRELSIIKAATHKALEWRMISEDPMAGYKLAKVANERVRYLEDDEFDRLMDAADAALAPVIQVARHTGMRLGEILNLDWSDVDLKRGWIRVRKAKNGESRFVPMSADLIDAFSHTPPSQRRGAVFARHGSRIGRDGWVRDRFTEAVRAAGLIDFHFHDLRHTWASQAAMRGMDVQTIAAVLGHKTLRMTQRYSHLSSAHLRASIELAAPRRSQASATKTLQSDLQSGSSTTDADGHETKTPPFLAGILRGGLEPGSGIEPPTSSLPMSTSITLDSSIKPISRRQYDPNAN
jgi:integrase